MHLNRPDLAGEMTLHGCLKTQARYDEHTTWAHILSPPLTSLEPGMSRSADMPICVRSAGALAPGSGRLSVSDCLRRVETLPAPAYLVYCRL